MRRHCCGWSPEAGRTPWPTAGARRWVMWRSSSWGTSRGHGRDVLDSPSWGRNVFPFFSFKDTDLPSFTLCSFSSLVSNSPHTTCHLPLERFPTLDLVVLFTDIRWKASPIFLAPSLPSSFTPGTSTACGCRAVCRGRQEGAGSMG